MLEDKFTKTNNCLNLIKKKSKEINYKKLNKNFLTKKLENWKFKINLKDINYDIKVKKSQNLNQIDINKFWKKHRYKSNYNLNIKKNEKNYLQMKILMPERNIKTTDSVKVKNIMKNFKIRFIMVNLLKFLKFWISQNLSYSDINKYYFPKQPYEVKISKKLFIYVKLNETKKVKDMISNKRFLVYQIDYLFRTILIHSCIKGYNKMTNIILSMCPNINHIDSLGKSAVEYLIINNNIKILKEIFVLNFKIKLNKPIEKLTQNFEIKYLFRIYNNKNN